MVWDADMLKEHIDELMRLMTSIAARDASALEQRLVLLQHALDDLQGRWSARFTELETRHDKQLADRDEQVDPLRRLVYIGLGLTLAVAAVLPLVLHKWM